MPISKSITPKGSFKISATDSSANQKIDTISLPRDNARIVIGGTDNAYIAFGGSSVTASNADMFMLNGVTEVFTIPEGTTHIAAISDDTNGCTVYITIGNGL